MRQRIGLIAVFTVAGFAAACGGSSGGGGPHTTPTPEPQPGSIEASWQFQGVESPNRVNLYLIDGQAAGFTCNTIPYTPSNGIYAQATSLPPTGTRSFPDLEEGSRWMVVAIGQKGNGVRVAEGCRDNISVFDDEKTQVDLTLENKPLEVAGNYATSLKLNLQLPPDIVQTLALLDLACSQLGLDPQVCDITAQVLDIMVDLDVEAEWKITQSNELVAGDMVWNTVEGADVGQWDLVSGGFSAEIPGATGLVFKAHTLNIKVDQLVLFVLTEVMNVDLGQFGPIVGIVVDELSNELISDIAVTSATGTARDVDVDGKADTIDGTMQAEISFPAFNYTHPFTMNWDADRM